MQDPGPNVVIVRQGRVKWTEHTDMSSIRRRLGPFGSLKGHNALLRGQPLWLGFGRAYGCPCSVGRGSMWTTRLIVATARQARLGRSRDTRRVRRESQRQAGLGWGGCGRRAVCCAVATATARWLGRERALCEETVCGLRGAAQRGSVSQRAEGARVRVAGLMAASGSVFLKRAATTRSSSPP